MIDELTIRIPPKGELGWFLKTFATESMKSMVTLGIRKASSKIKILTVFQFCRHAIDSLMLVILSAT